MARNWYSEALDIIACDTTDWKKLVVSIAKVHPKTLVIANTEVSGESWVDRCRKLMVAGEKIAAIKLCRTESGRGLKEAKEYVENMV